MKLSRVKCSVKALSNSASLLIYKRFSLALSYYHLHPHHHSTSLTYYDAYTYKDHFSCDKQHHWIVNHFAHSSSDVFFFLRSFRWKPWYLVHVIFVAYVFHKCENRLQSKTISCSSTAFMNFISMIFVFAAPISTSVERGQSCKGIVHQWENQAIYQIINWYKKIIKEGLWLLTSTSWPFSCSIILK